MTALNHHRNFDLGVVRNARLALDGGNGDGKGAKIVPLHGVGLAVPAVYQDVRKLWPSVWFWTCLMNGELTEIANKIGFFGIWCPFGVRDIVVGLHIEAVFLISLMAMLGFVNKPNPKGPGERLTLLNFSRPPSVLSILSIHCLAKLNLVLRSSLCGSNQGSIFRIPIASCQQVNEMAVLPPLGLPDYLPVPSPASGLEAQFIFESVDRFSVWVDVGDRLDVREVCLLAGAELTGTRGFFFVVRVLETGGTGGFPAVFRGAGLGRGLTVAIVSMRVTTTSINGKIEKCRNGKWMLLSKMQAKKRGRKGMCPIDGIGVWKRIAKVNKNQKSSLRGVVVRYLARGHRLNTIRPERRHVVTAPATVPRGHGMGTQAQRRRESGQIG